MGSGVRGKARAISLSGGGVCVMACANRGCALCCFVYIALCRRGSGPVAGHEVVENKPLDLTTTRHTHHPCNRLFVVSLVSQHY